MKSIRLSLIVYFLLLLAGALGAVSFLVYGITAQALQAKQETNRQLLHEQFEERRREEAAKLDMTLLAQARFLQKEAQTQYQSGLAGFRWLVAALQADTLGPSAHIPGLTALAMAKSPIYSQLMWHAQTRINLDEDMLHHDDLNVVDFMQINSEWGPLWRSKSLQSQPLPCDPAKFSAGSGTDWRFDSLDLEDGLRLRRVIFKAPIIKAKAVFPRGPVRFDSGAPRNRPSGTGRPMAPNVAGGSAEMVPAPAPRPPERFAETETRSVYFHYAVKRDELEQKLASLFDQENTPLRDLEAESQASLAQLRMRLLAIAMATFAAICVGGFLLVGYGLTPLRRLGEAVSRVSEKDFQLRIEGPPPPQELKPIIEGLQQSLEMLRQAFEREKQATADISHELRTPLAGLLTTLEVTLRKPRSAEDYRETVTECRDLAKQMTQLVERLLTLTRLDARSDIVRAEPVDAAVLAEQCATLVRPLARANDLTLQIHNGVPVPVTTDPDKLREVMANLMHNAIAYNRPAGTVDVVIRPLDGNGVDLEVRDTGIGISPEHRERIFERFFRADPSRHATGTHAGLGLAIVRGYVTLMGGSITVESEPGRGSTFRVRIPSTNPARK